jgi:hypothetical protein
VTAAERTAYLDAYRAPLLAIDSEAPLDFQKASGIGAAGATTAA